jgi:hypothetical protein
MILPTTLMLGAHLFLVVDSVPNLNVQQVCEGIAQQGGVTFRDPAIAQEKKSCVETEQQIRDQLARQWSSFPAADKTHCVNESTMGGESSYTELLTCLEMARDVRTMHLEEEGRMKAPAGAGPAKPPK